MLFSVKHKGKQEHDKQNHKQNKLAEGIVKRCIIVQDKASKVLRDKFETLSITAKRIVVGAYCILSFSCCLHLILKSFSKHTGNTLSITTINVQKQAGSKVKVVTEAESEKIEKHRDYLDSLGKNVSGKRILNNISMKRSGLVDSIKLLQKLYQLQSSNK